MTTTMTPRVEWLDPETLVDRLLADQPPPAAGPSFRAWLIAVLTREREKACRLICGGCWHGYPLKDDAGDLGHVLPPEAETGLVYTLTCEAWAIRRGWGGVRAELQCTDCGCSDSQGCEPPCWWLRVDRAAGTGLCSTCAPAETMA